MAFEKTGSTDEVKILTKDGWKTTKAIRKESLSKVKVKCPKCGELLPIEIEKCTKCGYSFKK
jgi:ribosomal protein L40E